MLAWIVGIFLILGSISYGFLVAVANGMGDNPTANPTPAWPALLGVALGGGVIMAHHFGIL